MHRAGDPPYYFASGQVGAASELAATTRSVCS